MAETQVLIVGAGPVGLTLALDLGQRGVRCVLIGGNETSIQLPKMERCNARTMEIYRRLGIAEKVRDAGLPRSARWTSFSQPRWPGPRLPPAVPLRGRSQSRNRSAQRRTSTRAVSTDLAYTLEPLLRSIVGGAPEHDSAFRLRIDLVHARWRFRNSACANEKWPRPDHSNSVPGWMRRRLQHRSKAARHPVAGRRQHSKAAASAFPLPGTLTSAFRWARAVTTTSLRAPYSRSSFSRTATRHWTLHAAATSDGENGGNFKKSLGMPVEFEMLSVNEWTQHCSARSVTRRAAFSSPETPRIWSSPPRPRHEHWRRGRRPIFRGSSLRLSPDGVARNCSPPMKKSAARFGLRNVKASRAAMSGGSVGARPIIPTSEKHARRRSNPRRNWQAASTSSSAR